MIEAGWRATIGALRLWDLSLNPRREPNRSKDQSDGKQETEHCAACENIGNVFYHDTPVSLETEKTLVLSPSSRGHDSEVCLDSASGCGIGIGWGKSTATAPEVCSHSTARTVSGAGLSRWRWIIVDFGPGSDSRKVRIRKDMTLSSPGLITNGRCVATAHMQEVFNPTTVTFVSVMF